MFDPIVETTKTKIKDHANETIIFVHPTKCLYQRYSDYRHRDYVFGRAQLDPQICHHDHWGDDPFEWNLQFAIFG